MEERIIKEKGDRDISTIKELSLDNCKSSTVTGLTEDWKNLEQLNLINVGLTSLKSFPRLPNLKKLELSDNNLCEGLDALACLPKLEEMNLSGNKIKDQEAFEPLGQINTLKKLSLFGCDICKTENYREKMFELIPSLLYLDGLDKNKESLQKNGVEGENGKEGEEGYGDEDSLSEGDEDSMDDEEDLDEEEDEEGEEDIPLEALYGKINDEGDDDDFEAVDDEDEDDDIEEEEEEDDTSLNVSRGNPEETEEVRGTKRKHDGDQ